MKTLILTCNTGQGHNSCASSITEVHTANGDFCETADTLSFLSKQASRVVDKCFTAIYRHMPKVFENMYSHSDTPDQTLHTTDSAIKILKLGCKRLYKYIADGGFDNVICVHLFPALMLTWIKEKYSLDVKVSLLFTDYTCYPYTSKTKVDLYFIPHTDLSEEFSSSIEDKGSIVASGIPIKRDFLSLPSKADARKSLGIADDLKIVFIMGGSMGCGPMKELVIKLSNEADSNTHFLVSCGTNKKLLRYLNKKHLPNATVFSFSNNIPTIMAAADLFVTKPGGISITEAAVSGLPTILINAIGACETPNYNFFVNHNYFYGASTVEGVTEVCKSLLCKPEQLKERSRLLKQEFGKDSAEEIYKALKTK